MSAMKDNNQHYTTDSRRRWRQVMLTATSSLLSITSCAAASSSSSEVHTTPSHQIMKTSQRNLQRPVIINNNKSTRRNLVVNQNLINYQPSSTAGGSSSYGYTQEELNKISQQTYGAPHTWVQCPTGGYAGYMPSYDCTAYIYCKNGKMKEEGYTLCQEGLLFHNGEKNCVWADQVHCDPDNFFTVSSSSGGSGSETALNSDTMTMMDTSIEGTMTTTTTSKTYSETMDSVTRNPRYQDEEDDTSYTTWTGWVDGKWVEPGSSSSTSTSKSDGWDDNMVITTWTNGDIVKFPKPTLQPYDIAQSSDGSTTTATTSLPKEFISQEGWSTQSRSSGSDSTKKVIGYYANWQWYSNQERPSPLNMQFTKLDRVNFAFFQTNDKGDICGTDTWADPAILFGPRNWNVEVPDDAGYAPQFNDNNGFNDKEGGEWNYQGNKYVNVGDDIYCHRTTPSGPRECNGHYYNKGLIGRAHSQGAQVYISIGGWSTSHKFPEMAKSASSRRNFAKNCVGLIREYGVDGIDIAWEWPGYTSNGGTEDDAKHLILLLKDVKAALNAYEKHVFPNGEKTYGLTAALPCIPDMISYQDVEELNEVLTELSLKSFDMHGAWDDKVGVNSPLQDQAVDKFPSPGKSIQGCTERWIQQGADITKINVGVPFFGRTFAGADRLYGPHGGSDTTHWKEYGGQPQYHEILDSLSEMISLRDDVTMTQYAYFEDGGLVSYDNMQSICDKVEYTMEKSYHGIYIWDLSGDFTATFSSPLLDTVNMKLERGSDVDCELFRAETRDENGNVVQAADTEPNPWYADWNVNACLNDGMQSVYTKEEALYRRKEECCMYSFQNEFNKCVNTATAAEDESSSTTEEVVITADVETVDTAPILMTQTTATRSTLAAELGAEPPVTWCMGGCDNGHKCVGNQNHPQTIDDNECKKCNEGQTYWPCDVDGLCFCWDPDTPRIPPAPSSGKAQLSDEKPCDFFTEDIFNKLAPSAQHPYTYQGLCDAIDNYNEHHAEKAFMMGTEFERKAEFAAFLGHTLHESDEWRASREYLVCADNKVVDGEVFCKPCDSGSFNWETFKCDGVGLVGDGLTYNGYCDYVLAPPVACECTELQSEPPPLDGYVPANKVYFGRGAIQTSWNYNYRPASDALTGDSSTFCDNPDLIATVPEYAWGAGVFFWMESLKEEITCHIAALRDHDFGGTLNTINGGLECPAYHGGWHGEAIKLRLNRYCKSTKALGLESILPFDGCKGLADSFAECLEDGTCPDCKQFASGVTMAVEAEEPVTVPDTEEIEVTTPNPTSPPVAAPSPPVAEEAVVESDTSSSCPSGMQPVDGLPDCCVPEPAYHGDGACDPDAPYNTAACNYDGGDCCKETCNLESTYGCSSESFGYGPFGYYCQNPALDEYINSDECTVSDRTRIGDGRCDADVEMYNTAACNWDGGDCCEQTCDDKYAHFECGDPAYPYYCQNNDATTTTTTTATTTTSATRTTTTTTPATTIASTTTTTTAAGLDALYQSNSAFVVKASDDATIKKPDPDSNFGLESSLTVKGLSAGPNAIDSVLKFTIPPSDGVSTASAVLRIYSLADSTSGGIFHLAPEPSLSDWWEGSVTWNNAPDWEDRIINIGAVEKDQWYTMDVSDAVTSLHGFGGQLAIRIRSRDPSIASYSSRQGTHPPEILMSYEDTSSTEVVANADPISSSTSSTVATSQLSPDSQVLFPSDDASIVRDRPDENHGSDEGLEIDQDSGNYDALIRFDMSSVDINSVTSAILRLYCTDGSTYGGFFTTSAPNWNEETVTWSNAPSAHGVGVLGTLGNVYAGEWYEVDVSKVFVNPSNSLSKALSIRISSENWNRVVYSSKEGSDPPQLLLKFGANQSTTAETTSGGTETTSGGGACERDVKICPDGTFISRDEANSCQFGSCPFYDAYDGTGKYYPVWGPGGSVACLDGSMPPTWATGAYLKNSKEECCKTYSSLKVAECLSSGFS